MAPIKDRKRFIDTLTRTKQRSIVAAIEIPHHATYSLGEPEL
jgi:hypothetical protein